MAYQVLIDGKDLAEIYGINAFPTSILIDSKVLYADGFDESKIEKLFEKAL